MDLVSIWVFQLNGFFEFHGLSKGHLVKGLLKFAFLGKGKGLSRWGVSFSPRKNSGYFLKIFRIAE